MTLLVDDIPIPLKTPLPVEDDEVTSNVFRRHGNLWRISFQGVITSRKPSLRWDYTHELLKRPNEQIGAIELSRQFDCPAYSAVQVHNENEHVLGLIPSCDISEEIMPSDTRGRVLKHLENLRSELSLKEAADDLRGASETRDEIDRIEEHLRSTTFSGRSARFYSNVNRARNRVSVAIARAIEDLRSDIPALARHLDNSIRTGKRCIYQPETQIKWQL